MSTKLPIADAATPAAALSTALRSVVGAHTAWWRATLVAALAICALLGAPTADSRAATFIVKLNSDLDDGNLADHACSTVEHTEEHPNPPDRDTCTLRAAIQNANLDDVPDHVWFDLTGSKTIALGRYLPNLHEPVDIDGWSGDTPSGPTIPQPPVRIDGRGLPRVPCPSEPDQGVDPSPMAQNDGHGFLVFGAHSRVHGLNISGFPCDEVVVWEADHTTISGNYIGTNQSGTVMDVFGTDSGEDGVYVHHAVGVIVGGTTRAEGNVVTTQASSGIFVAGGSSETQVQFNKVGVDPGGGALTRVTGGVGPTWGISLEGRQRTGPDPMIALVVADNQVAGLNDAASDPIAIRVGHGVRGAYIERNLIGTNAAGNPLFVNGQPFTEPQMDGIAIVTVLHELSSDVVIKSNVVGGVGNGIRLQGQEVAYAHVEGNTIGMSRDLATGLPNAGVGVLITEGSNHNVVGYGRDGAPDRGCDRDLKCNVIANSASGVALETPPRLTGGTPSAAAEWPNTIRGNAIFRNVGAGIDRIGYGVTPNDLTDTNPDFPEAVTRSLKPGTSKTVVSGIVRVPDPRHADLKIDVYRLDHDHDQRSGPNDRGVIRPGHLVDGVLEWPHSPAPANPSSFGEGREFVGTVAPGDIAPDGRWRFEVPGPPIDNADAFTATVTDAGGDTSEFSEFCLDVDGNGKADNDGDGLCDDWEQFGIDVDGDGSNDLPLPEASFKADPNQRDVFVEVDFVDNDKPHDRPESGAIAGFRGKHDEGLSAVVKAFSDRGVALHLSPGRSNLVDEPTPAADVTSFGPGSDFERVRSGDPAKPCDGWFGTFVERHSANCAAILRARATVVRYALFANSLKTPQGTDAEGASERGGSNLIVAVGHHSDADAKKYGGYQVFCSLLEDCWGEFHAGVFMHELGHALGLQEGGVDDIGFKPNHLSAMNPAYTTRVGVPLRKLDFATYQLPPLDEDNLREHNGLGLSGLSPTELADLKDHFPEMWWKGAKWPAGCPDTVKPVAVDRAIDWNNDGVYQLDPVTQYLRADFSTGNQCYSSHRRVLVVAPEWPLLDYNFRDWQPGDFGYLETTLPPADEAADAVDSDGDDVSDLSDNCKGQANASQADADHDGWGDVCDALNTGADLKVTMSASPLTTPHPGDTITHTATVTNRGPEDATNVRVDVSFTPGFTIIDATPGAGTAYVGTVWSVAGALAAGESKTLVVKGTFDSPYAAAAEALGDDQGDGVSGNDTATWWAGPTAPGNPVPVAQIPPDAFFCAQGDDDGSSGYDTSSGLCFGDPVLAGAGQADVAVSIPTYRRTAVGAGHVQVFGVDVGKHDATTAVTGVRLAVPIPAGTHVIRTEAGGGSYDPSTGVWNAGTLNGTTVKALKLVLETTGSGPVTVTARISHVDQEQSPAGDVASATSTAPIPAPPANDDLADAVDLTGPRGTVSGTTIAATAERFEPYDIGTPPDTGMNWAGQDRASVWYRWHAPATGVLTLETRVPGDDGVQPIDLYAGPPTALRSVALPIVGNSIFGRVVAGHTYTIAVAASPTDSQLFRSADFELEWDLRTPPSNDAFADAITLSGRSGSRPASTFGSTTEPGEPLPVIGLGGTLWYRFDAPAGGTFRFSASRAGVIAYRGDQLGSLAKLDISGQFSRDTGGNFPQRGDVQITVQRGERYYFVAGVAGGAFTAVDGMTDGSVQWQYTVTDTDGDGVRDDAPDNCPAVPNPGQEDDDGDGMGNACQALAPDADGDGIADDADNCPERPNPSQTVSNGNGPGDACNPTATSDYDADGVADPVDVCAEVFDPGQADQDGDGRGDACDLEPVVTVAHTGATITSGTPTEYTVTLTPRDDVDDPVIVLHPGQGLHEPEQAGGPWSCAADDGLVRCTLPGHVLAGHAAQPLVVRFATRPPFDATCDAGDACASLEAEYPAGGYSARAETPVDPFQLPRLDLDRTPRQLLSLPGAYVDVTATVSNDGTAPMPDQLFTLRPGSGALTGARIAGPANGWSCDVGGGVADTQVTCARVATLSPNADAPPVRLRFDVSPSDRFGSCIDPTVGPRCIRVRSQVWTSAGPSVLDGPTVETRIAGGPVLSIDLDDAGRAVTQGDNGRYDVAVTNTGSTLDPGPIVVGLSTCRPDGGPCQATLDSFAGPVGPDASGWTCSPPLGGGASPDPSGQVCAHDGPLAPGAVLHGSFAWRTRTNAASRDAGRCADGRACIYVRAAIGETEGAGDGPSDEETSPLVPLWKDLPVPGGLHATLTGPEGTELTSVRFEDPPDSPATPSDASFPYGVLSFHLDGVTPGSVTSVDLELPGPVDGYYKLSGSGDSWESFAWDGDTGARFGSGHHVTLTIRDGGRGDGDGTANGAIDDPGAPARLDHVQPLPPPPPPPPPPPDVTPPDVTPPVATLSGPRVQRVGPRLSVTVRCADEPCTARARASIRVPRHGRTRPRTYQLAVPGQPLARGVASSLVLRVPAKTQRAIRSALRARKKIEVVVAVTVSDAAGNNRSYTRRVRLKL